MRIAFLLPSLVKTAPIVVAANIIKYLKEKCDIEVFYFKDEIEIDLGVPTHKLNFFKPIGFENFDLLHSHLFRPDLFVSMHHKKIKCRTISTMHCFIKDDIYSQYQFPKNYLVTKAWYNALRNLNYLVCLNHTMANDYQKRYPRKKIFVVNNGVEPDTHSGTLSIEDSRQLNELKKKYRIIGTSSQLIRRKGLEIIISFLQTNTNYAWYAAGAGLLENELKNKARAAGVADRCIFAGYKKNMPAIYPWYDIFAFPSKNDGFGLSLIEAAMYKRPIICSDIAMFLELFDEEEVAFFTLNDPVSFSMGVRKLEQSTEIYAGKAYDKMINNYTAPIMAENYYSIYKEITG